MSRPEIRSAISVMLACLLTVSVSAAEKPEKISAQTELDLYVTATEAWQMLQENNETILIDVRDPVEIKFTGFATPTHIHVPWMLADLSGWE